MSSSRILVVGSTGMVGRAVTSKLRAAGHDVVRSARNPGDADVVLDLADLPPLEPLLDGIDLVVDAAGVLRGQLDYPGDRFRLAAAQVNTVWPLTLAAAAAGSGTRVLHVSTDAVFAPGDDPAGEHEVAEPVEPYGQSKLMGESIAPHVLNVRCSVIGPAPDRGVGLWEWVASSPAGATVSGYVDHAWAGCTSGQLAQLAADLVPAPSFQRARAGGPSPHFAPNGTVAKADVLQLLAERLRPDLTVDLVPGPGPGPRPLVASPALHSVYAGPQGWAAAFAAVHEVGPQR